jgi:hypothetical protein
MAPRLLNLGSIWRRVSQLHRLQNPTISTHCGRYEGDRNLFLRRGDQLVFAVLFARSSFMKSAHVLVHVGRGKAQSIASRVANSVERNTILLAALQMHS